MPVLEVHTATNGKKYIIQHHKRHYLHNMRKQPLISYVANKEVIYYPSRKRSQGRKNPAYDFAMRSPKRKKPANRAYPYLYDDKYKRHKRVKRDPVLKHIKDVIHRNEREWNHTGPRSIKEKQEVFQYCGDPCFLNSRNHEYAVCKRCAKDHCYCYPDCSGLMHAKRVAARNGNKAVEGAALKLADQLGCDWTQLLKHEFANKYSKSLKLLGNF